MCVCVCEGTFESVISFKWNEIFLVCFGTVIHHSYNFLSHRPMMMMVVVLVVVVLVVVVEYLCQKTPPKTEEILLFEAGKHGLYQLM